MKNLYLCIAFTLISMATLFAKPVTPERAERIAVNFWAQNNGSDVTLTDVTSETEFENLYIFTTPDRMGFVILSADDKALPILGYSFTNRVRTDSLPQNLINWLKGTGDYIAWIVKNDKESSAEVQKEWSRLESQFTTNAPAIVNVVSALLTTTWSQSPYYNNLCPSDNGGKCVTGCTATATAQVMKYYNHPTTGHGSHSYRWNSNTLSADFGSTTYQWSNMPNSLGSSSTTAQDNAVATLMYHVGIACEMDYGSSGSGAPAINYNSMSYACAENALRDYFKYDWGISSIEYDYFTDQKWKSILKNELDNLRPVIYTGFDTESGHCFVCDGYNSSEQFHINWGWGGYYDGYYAIGHLNPGGSGTGGSTSGTYNINNQAIVGIKPNTNEGGASTLTYSVNNPAYGSVSVTEGTASMTNYATETELLATANEGYRFTGWSDGSIYNPRSFKSNGGTINVTANFAPCGGDTAYYCHEGLYYGYGSNSTMYWGIRIPASQLRANDSLHSVMTYLVEDGSYTFTIYNSGTTSPQTQIATQTFNLQGEGWKTLSFTSPVAIDNTKPLWIVVNHTGSGYFIPVTYYSGNGDGDWYGGTSGSSWSKLSSNGKHYTYLLKAIFYTDPSSMATLTGTANPPEAGNVDGTGNYNKGTEATVFALANPGYKFVGWEDGGMDQPRTITMNSNKSVTANFVSLKADTMTYSVNDEYLNAIGTSSSYAIYWAVKFDTAALKPQRQIKAVQLFDVSSSSTGMYIYKGGETSPKTLEKSYATITTTDAERYNTYNLPNPYHIDNTEPLWIVFKCDNSSSHPCAYTHYSGNNNGCYLKLGSSSWESLTESDFYGSWMIKVITEEDDGTGVEELNYYASNIYTTGLDVNVVISDGEADVRIYDAGGKLVMSERQNSSMKVYSMPVAGIYYVVVNNNQVTKVVVK